MKLTGLRLGFVSIFVLLMLSILVGCSNVRNESVAVGDIGEENGIAERSLSSRTMLKSITDVSPSDVLLDISQNPTKHIKGSITIPYTDFAQLEVSPSPDVRFPISGSRRDLP